jgi:hypothetical protein
METSINEFHNVKYKPILINGMVIQETKASNELSNLDKFLENEKNNNETEPWCKLNKTIKSKKLIEYVSVYQLENNLNETECDHLITFLRDCLDRKKLNRVKDVMYDKEKGIITSIPALCYMKSSNHFTLKNIDKRVSTLKSLAPKNSSHGTIRKKECTRANSDTDEDD